MPFPHHDAYWTDVVRFLQARGLDTVPMTAPVQFNEVFPTIYPYAESYGTPPPETPVTIVHKGLLDQIERNFLERQRASGQPTFANEVFVVYTERKGLPVIAADVPHLRALTVALASCPVRAHASLNRPAEAKSAFSALSVEGVRAEMNRRYSSSACDEFGGYEHPHLWDRVRFEEVNRQFARLVGPLTGGRILELGCGIGRNVELSAGCQSYLGIDLSDVAIAKAQGKFADRPALRFRRMDAMNLDLPDAAFDVVLAIEIIEHVQDAERLLREAHRVLVPNGRLLLNSANRDSLHLRVVRAMGLPEATSTHEHFREFGFGEMSSMVRDVGFQVEASAGVFLHPYLAPLPNVDARIQAAVADHPDLVADLRELGERVGAEFGYEFVMAVRKR